MADPYCPVVLKLAFEMLEFYKTDPGSWSQL